jgi:four helix bundle protein
MKESILREKSYHFALRIIKLYQFMSEGKKEFGLSKQILRAGTSNGAKIEEDGHVQSKIDFVHKLSIAQKAAAETNYWLRLLRDSHYLTAKQSESVLIDCEEIQKMLTTSIKTAKANLNSGE